MADLGESTESEASRESGSVGDGALSMDQIAEALRETQGEVTATNLASYADAGDPDGQVGEPMVTTALPLPNSLLEKVRDLATAQNVKTAAWLRAVVEAEVARTHPGGQPSPRPRLEDTSVTGSE